MALGSNNPFPSVLFVEQGSTPTTPAAGRQRLYPRSSDGKWVAVDDAAAVTVLNPDRITTIPFLIDGGGSTITTGLKGFFRVPFACTITGWQILSTDATGPATAGSIVIDIWKDTTANYPPTVLDTITASAKPTLSAASSATSTTLTGWTTSVAAGDVFAFNVDSVTTVTQVLIHLTVTIS